MNVSKISYGLVSVALMAGALTSCSETKYEDKAKSEAVKYLRGDELLKAERFANQQTNSDKYSGEAIAYWDSLLIEAKSKEAYIKGQKLIQDSLNGIHYRKNKYRVPLDTIIKNEDIINDTREEYAKYITAEDFIRIRNNAPKDYVSGAYNNMAVSTRYWNLITLAGKQNEAYQKGMADARQELIKK